MSTSLGRDSLINPIDFQREKTIMCRSPARVVSLSSVTVITISNVIEQKMRISSIMLLFTASSAQDGTPDGYCWRQFQKYLLGNI